MAVKSESNVALVPQSGQVARRCRYCIPMIVPEELAYSIWERQTPDMVAEGHELGCNRWGDKQYSTRSVRSCRSRRRAALWNSNGIIAQR